jgi:hypothetical protein
MLQSLRLSLTAKMNFLFILSTVIICVFVSSCEACKGPTPIPREKEAFIGIWKSEAGFELEILQDGTANIYQNTDPSNPDYESLNIKPAPDEITAAQVNFLEDNKLQIIKPLNYSREYKINYAPYFEDGKYYMVLNRKLLIRK